MAKIFVFLFAVTMAVAALAVPILEPEDTEYDTEFYELQPDFSVIPNPRITCDLLSGIGWANTFCAGHCLFKGFKGGYCNSQGVCVCRN